MTDTLHFKTVAAANLFTNEITGQLSDGNWENAKPLDHWQYWCHAQVVVDGQVGHVGTPKRTSYGLNVLKRYIKDDMLSAIKITKMPWFDFAKHAYLTRLLTNSMYVENQNMSIWELNKHKMEDEATLKASYRKSYECLINARTEAALKAICGRPDISHFDKSFIETVKDECVNQLYQNELASAIKCNEEVDRKWELLKAIGVNNLDELRQMIKTIRDVPVTERELNDALVEVLRMFEVKLG